MRRLFCATVSILFLMSVMGLFQGPAPASAEKLPRIIVLGANPTGSLFHSMAVGIGKVVGEHTPMKIEILPQGASVWFPMMTTEEVQFGIDNPGDILAAYTGSDIYKKATKGKGYPIRTLLLGCPMGLALVVPGDSDIKTPKDIIGKRIPTDYGAFYTSTLTVRALLANFGLTDKDVKAMKVTGYVDGVRALIEGRADITFGSIGSGIIEELKSAKGARYLSVDNSPEAVKRMQEVHPGYYVTKVKPGPAGVTDGMYALAKDVTLVVPTDLSEAVAYAITKALWENYKELAPLHPKLKSWTPDRFASTHAVIPYHEGSIKFFKEKGVWTKELEERQKQLLKIK